MHLAKHMQFHGVEYIVVPLELWKEGKDAVAAYADAIAYQTDVTPLVELHANMCAYDNSNEPEEIPNE
jgi:hypothetical protein